MFTLFNVVRRTSMYTHENPSSKRNKMRLLLTFIFNTLFFHCHWSYGSSLSGEETYIHNNQLESAKYSSLPHTIFSPQGRLYNVEKNALMASDPTDVSSSLVVVRFHYFYENNQKDCNIFLILQFRVGYQVWI